MSCGTILDCGGRAGRHVPGGAGGPRGGPVLAPELEGNLPAAEQSRPAGPSPPAAATRSAWRRCEPRPWPSPPPRAGLAVWRGPSARLRRRHAAPGAGWRLLLAMLAADLAALGRGPAVGRSVPLLHLAAAVGRGPRLGRWLAGAVVDVALHRLAGRDRPPPTKSRSKTTSAPSSPKDIARACWRKTPAK